MSDNPDDRSALIEKTVIDITIEVWRFSQSYQRAIKKLEQDDQVRFMSQARYFMKQLESHLDSCGLRIVSLEGQPFDAGCAATALNLTDFPPGEPLVVAQMLEPIVLDRNGAVRRMGTVLLGSGLS